MSDEPLPAADPVPAPVLPGQRRRAHLVGGLLLVAVVAASSWVRIHSAISAEWFDRDNPVGMLKSDPGLLYWFVERLVENGGLPPVDFGASLAVQWPDPVDLFEQFTICQEFPIAWARLVLGDAVPLHVLCVVVMSIFASLTAAGAYLLTFELTGRVRWAVLATVLFALLPANYRTIGFVLVREDFSVPWFALHLALLARAGRVGTRGGFVLAAVPLVLALASWHAMVFFAALEAAALYAWFLRTGRNPFTGARAGGILLVLAVSALLVPVLRAKLFILSAPMLFAGSLWLASVVPVRFVRSGWRRRAAALGFLAGLVAASVAVSQGLGAGDYSHVFELLLAKVRHLGTLPADPGAISFEARLLWQGPFDTATPAVLGMQLAMGLVGLALAVASAGVGWLRGRAPELLRVLEALSFAALPVAFLIQRTILLPGLLLPVLLAVLLARLPRPRIAMAAMALLLLAQVAFFSVFLDRVPASLRRWYIRGQAQEIADVVRWIDRNVPAGEAIAADFVNSTPVLAHTGRPILLQPKYESRDARRRAEEFLTLAIRGRPAQLATWLRQHRCRYLLIDRATLWAGTRYLVGLSDTMRSPEPGTAMRTFVSTNRPDLESLPGFELLYRSRRPTDLLRLYRVE